MAIDQNNYIPLGDELDFYSTEAYNTIRTNLSYSIYDNEHRRCRYIGVVSADPQEGKSTATINIAYAFAKAGKKVLLLECDLRKPTIKKKLRLADEIGLTELVTGQATLENTIIKSSLNENLSIILSGAISPNPSEMLGSDAFKSLLESFSNEFDYVIIDLPPIDIVPDALTVAHLIDGYVFMVRLNYSQKKRIVKAISLLKNINGRILGFITTGFKTKSSSYKYRKYGRYGKYHYYYESKEENKDEEKK